LTASTHRSVKGALRDYTIIKQSRLLNPQFLLKNTTSHSRDVLQAKMSLPNEQKALVIEEGQKLKIVKSPVPKLKADHEILVKVVQL